MNSDSNKKNAELSLRETVVALQNYVSPAGISIGEIFRILGLRGHAFLVLFLSVPFVQPLPMLGLSSPLGIMIAILGVFIATGKSPWLPKKLKEKKIKYELMQSCCNVLSKILKKTEHFIKPRYSFWINYRLIRVWDGLLIAVFGFLLALPLPIPFTNMLPGIFLVLNAIGWLEKDGIAIILSYVIAMVVIVFFVGIAGGVTEALLMIQQKLSDEF